MRALISLGSVSLLFLQGGCDAPTQTGPQAESSESASVATGSAGGAPTPATPAPAVLPELIPPAPGEVGGLPDDRTPLAEGKIDPKSAQGAAQVLQQYGIALEQRRWTDARSLWRDLGIGSGLTEAEFAAAYDKYSEIHVLIGAPGETDGAAGSIFVEVPVQMYGRLKEGDKPFNLYGPVTLRRVNDVDGATPAQLRWHIASSALKPMGVVREAPAATAP